MVMMCGLYPQKGSLMSIRVGAPCGDSTLTHCVIRGESRRPADLTKS